jgi:tripartite-type tricarboxylate transporter receptor subunit TctC
MVCNVESHTVHVRRMSMTEARKKVLFGMILLMAGILALMNPSTTAQAKEYPDRAVTLVVPFAPGGVTDLAARAVANGLEKQLKQTVMVVNKPGGGTTVGGNAVATAKPDGYTLAFCPTSTANPEVFTYFYEAPYSSKDLQPVSRVTTAVLAITVKADAPWNSLKDLVEYARKNPGVKVATHGKNSLGFVTFTVVGKADGVKFVDVPFGGDTQIIPAILGGHVLVGTPSYPSIKSLLDAKKLKALALCIEKRAEFAPGIPTVVELGYKLGGYFSPLGVFAPKGTPADIVKKLDAAVANITKDTDFKGKMSTMGYIVTYENTTTFEKTQAAYRENLTSFFKEQGLVK